MASRYEPKGHIQHLEVAPRAEGILDQRELTIQSYQTTIPFDYEAMNAVYRSYFPADRLPARTCVGVTGLARGALVEIDMVARRP